LNVSLTPELEIRQRQSRIEALQPGDWSLFATLSGFQNINGELAA
jgi:hypothetical protein